MGLRKMKMDGGILKRVKLHLKRMMFLKAK
jgi:hypothetical protein